MYTYDVYVCVCIYIYIYIYKALTSILNATSDAVVRLDAELKIVGPIYIYI